MSGVELIAEERERQIGAERHAEIHDDEHVRAELARLAACYIMVHVGDVLGGAVTAGRSDYVGEFVGNVLPTGWALKPKDAIRNLARAGALIAAEIDRLQRAEARS